MRLKWQHFQTKTSEKSLSAHPTKSNPRGCPTQKKTKNIVRVGVDLNTQQYLNASRNKNENESKQAATGG